MKILLCLIIMLSGCFFGRVDVEPDRTSVTVWTLGKDVSIDPNDWYQSTSNRVTVDTVYGEVGTE